MSDVQTYSSDVAFTPAVKAIQTRKGSRDAYANVEERGGWRTEIDEDLAGFSGGDQQLLSRDRLGRRPALYPASRRPEGLCQNPRQEHDRVRRLTAATGNTSRKAICRRIRRRIFS